MSDGNATQLSGPRILTSPPVRSRMILLTTRAGCPAERGAHDVLRPTGSTPRCIAATSTTYDTLPTDYCYYPSVQLTG